jgi:hypothetical protein
LTDIDDEDTEIGSVSVTKDDADEGEDSDDDEDDDVEDDNNAEDDELPDEKANVQLKDGDDMDLDDDYQDVMDTDVDVDLVQLDSAAEKKGKGKKSKYQLVVGDSKRPCKKIKYVSKKKKTYYSAYKFKVKKNGNKKYKQKNIWSSDKLDSLCNVKAVTAKTTKAAKTESALSENDKAEEDTQSPPGGKMKFDKKLGMKVLKWKIGGDWLNEEEYIKYFSKKDPHTMTEYWDKTQKSYRFKNKMTDDEASCYSERYPDLKAAFNGDIGALKNHWTKYGRKEKRNKFCYTDMTEEETKCYLKRFPDVSFTTIKWSPKTAKKKASSAKKKGEKWNAFDDDSKKLAENPVQHARDHYDVFGHFERRNTKCAPRITDIQAECYLRRYQDLADAFQDAQSPINKAKKHWYKYGFNEKRDHRCYAPNCDDEQCKNKYLPKNVQIQQNHPKYKKKYGGSGYMEFRCNGDAHYGRIDTKPHKGDLRDGATPSSWADISNYNYGTKSSDGSNKIDCSNSEFGNTNPEFWKQCMCEKKPRFSPRFCSKEGGTCK